MLTLFSFIPSLREVVGLELEFDFPFSVGFDACADASAWCDEKHWTNWKLKKNHYILLPIPFCLINITSFSSISYWSNSEYWIQKHMQNGNIHFIILDVHVDRQSMHLGRQDREKTDYQTEVMTLIQQYNRDRIRHASGPVHAKHWFRYINTE